MIRPQPKPKKRKPEPRKRIARGKRPSPIRKTTLAELVRTCDDLVRQIVRTRQPSVDWKPGMCERCIVNPGTDTAHGIARDYFGTRWDLRNVFHLCRYCHEWLGKTRARMAEFMVRKRGAGICETLRLKAQAITKVTQPDLALLAAHLRRILEENP